MNVESVYGELRESNDAIRDAVVLNQRLDEDGYLFFRELLDPARVMELRREMLSVMQQGGWLVAGTDPVEGIADPAARSTEGDPEYTDVYHEVYKLESFHEIAHDRRIMDVMERIRDCTMMPQPAKSRSTMVSKIHRAHDPRAPRLCAFSRQFRQSDVLEPRGGLPA